MDAADSRARLLAAGLDLFTERGYAATSVEQLCERAGVSTADFERDFGSRERLVIALHDDANHRALAAMIVALDEVPADDVRGRIVSATRTYLEVMTSDRRWARIAIVESSGVSAAVEEHRRTAIARFTALMEFEAERLATLGILERRDFHMTAVAMTGAIYGMLNTWTADVDWQVEVERIVEEGTRLIMLALGLDPEA